MPFLVSKDVLSINLMVRKVVPLRLADLEACGAFAARACFPSDMRSGSGPKILPGTDY